MASLEQHQFRSPTTGDQFELTVTWDTFIGWRRMLYLLYRSWGG